MARLYLARLQQPNGLFHHGLTAPFFWGRGNGWVAAGLAEILVELPEGHPGRPPILEGYRRMMAALRSFQAPGGMWRQLIDRPDSWEESSATAMFGYAFALGDRQGLLKEAAYARAARRAWQALAPRVSADGQLAGISIGTGQSADSAYYLARPTVAGDLHGQAALLWLASELV
jgi:rhamnogalacturonyl hydrolase YesR